MLKKNGQVESMKNLLAMSLLIAMMGTVASADFTFSEHGKWLDQDGSTIYDISDAFTMTGWGDVEHTSNFGNGVASVETTAMTLPAPSNAAPDSIFSETMTGSFGKGPGNPDDPIMTSHVDWNIQVGKDWRGEDRAQSEITGWSNINNRGINTNVLATQDDGLNVQLTNGLSPWDIMWVATASMAPNDKYKGMSLESQDYWDVNSQTLVNPLTIVFKSFPN